MTAIHHLAAGIENTRRLRNAERGRRYADQTPVSRVTLRYAAAGDAERLRQLAELDSAAAVPSEALIAEIDGRIRAALPFDGSRPIADPFNRGTELIELLRLRAAQLGRPRAA
jgi:hypothetical protein